MPLGLLAAVAAVFVGATSLFGCARKVVELNAVDAGRDAPPFPAPFCVDYDQPSGMVCTDCYDEWGSLLDGGCTVPQPERCVVRGDGTTTRCVQCEDPLSSALRDRACLSCVGEPDVAGCRICEWSDGVGHLCRLCVDASGVVVDDCNRQRPELTP
jgi:hypothetical protein